MPEILRTLVWPWDKVGGAGDKTSNFSSAPPYLNDNGGCCNLQLPC